MHAKGGDAKAMAGQDRPWAYWLLFSIHIADDLVRTGFMIFLPFLLRDKGADLPTIGLGLSLLFAGGAAGKLVMGWVGARLGVVPSVILTEVATTMLILALLPLSLPLALALLPAVGLMLNGTSSVLYGTIPEFVSPERRTHAFAVFYTGGSVAGATGPFLAGLLGDAVGLPIALCRRLLHRPHRRADGVGAAPGLPLRLGAVPDRPHRPQPDALAQVLVGHLDRIGDVRAGRLHHQDRLGDRLEVGAEMHRRFQAQDRHRRWLDADMAEHLLVGRLDALAGQHRRHAARLVGHQRHRADLEAGAAIERPGADELAVTQLHHAPVAPRPASRRHSPRRRRCRDA